MKQYHQKILQGHFFGPVKSSFIQINAVSKKIHRKISSAC